MVHIIKNDGFDEYLKRQKRNDRNKVKFWLIGVSGYAPIDFNTAFQYYTDYYGCYKGKARFIIDTYIQDTLNGYEPFSFKVAKNKTIHITKN